MDGSSSTLNPFAASLQRSEGRLIRYHCLYHSTRAMAREASSSSSGRSNPSQPTMVDQPSTSKGFTQRFQVVENTPTPSSASTSTRPIVTQDITATQFAGHTRAMEERAIRDTREGLAWVARFSEGPVDRRAFREAVSVLSLCRCIGFLVNFTTNMLR